MGNLGIVSCAKRLKRTFFRYMVGQFSELKRKSIEPIALSVENGTVRSMQRAVSDAVWDEDKMISRYHGLKRGFG